ncbi:MAG: TlpA family protein disulfide reductase [Candidatus Melainabacteria bacterium]|nr:TlpA family protein disulfide reductase [Candidatus Melainabacteria bacterium]
MVALTEGTKAPSFTLRGIDSASYSLQTTLKHHAVVLLSFFKVSCPVCQLTLPYLERLHRSYRTVPIWGISQDDADATQAFARMYGLTFPMLLDEGLDSTVNYDLTNVPSTFLVCSEQTILLTTVGFVKANLEQLNVLLARLVKQTEVPLFSAADEVPELKPG